MLEAGTGGEQIDVRVDPFESRARELGLGVDDVGAGGSADRVALEPLVERCRRRLLAREGVPFPQLRREVDDVVDGPSEVVQRGLVQSEPRLRQVADNFNQTLET